MEIDRVRALQAEREAVVAFGHGLSDEEWSTPSRCPGWSVQDTLAHMAAVCHGAFTPWFFKLMRSKDIERSNDADVEARRGRPAAQVLGEYEGWSRRFATMQKGMQRPPLDRVPIPLAELGRYPARLLASAIVFDTYLHLRHDMAPAVGRSVPPNDPGAMAVVVEWMMAGLPAMSGDRLGWLERPVELRLVGDGGGRWGVVPAVGGHPSVVPGPVSDPAARIESPVGRFPIWATRRQPWRSDEVSVQGDEGTASRFLDAVAVI